MNKEYSRVKTLFRDSVVLQPQHSTNKSCKISELVGTKPMFKDKDFTKEFFLVDSIQRVHLELVKLKKTKAAEPELQQMQVHMSIRDKSKETLVKLCQEIENEQLKAKQQKD